MNVREYVGMNDDGLHIANVQAGSLPYTRGIVLISNTKTGWYMI